MQKGDASVQLPSGRVWVTSFWGFNPEGDGYLGFTRESDREWFLQRWQPGDLVMVYATKGPKTVESERERVLGFLEIASKRIRDVERMSPAGKQWKINEQVTNRWSFAVPVVRAWRTVELPIAKEIAPDTLRHSAKLQIIASRGELLTPEEAAKALAIQVRPTDVYGEPTLSDKEKAAVYTPSRGFPMSFGMRSFETHDGAHFLYALQLDGDPALLLNEPAHLLRGKIVVKIGLAKDPADRCAQLNLALPPAGKLKWKLALRSRPLSDGQTALDAETLLKQSFGLAYRSLGGEFFLCDSRTLPGEFAKAGSQVLI